MKLATITKDNDCIYLTQEIDTNNIYEKAKIIVKFCDKETKLFEKEIDRAILDIFERNGINIPNTSKSVLKQAYDLLKANRKDISITDLFTQTYMGCVRVKRNDLFGIYLENDNHKEIIECGVEIKEITLWNKKQKDIRNWKKMKKC